MNQRDMDVSRFVWFVCSHTRTPRFLFWALTTVVYAVLGGGPLFCLLSYDRSSSHKPLRYPPE